MNKPERVKCKCHCHVDKNVKHVIPCCDNGWIELPTLPAPTVATDNRGELEKGLFNGMNAEQLIVWLDRRCGFNDHQKDYVHAILIKLIKSKVTVASPVEEDQERIWDELEEKVKNNQWFAGDLYNYMKSRFILTQKS